MHNILFYNNYFYGIKPAFSSVNIDTFTLDFMNTAQESPLLASFIQHQTDLLRFLSFKLSCAETAGD